MVNIRYHIVSLVAVFLALALGVVLGAGPLQSRIAGSAEEGAQSQIEQLTEETSAYQADIEQLNQFIDGVGAEVLPETLSDRAIGIIMLPGASAQSAQEITEQLQLAGADVVGTVSLAQAAVSLGQRDYRESLAGPVSSHLSSGGSGSADQTIAEAIVEVLTTEGAERNLLTEILTDSNTPLIEGETLPNKPADTLVILGPAEETNAGEDDLSQPIPGALVALANAAGTVKNGAVAVGNGENETNFIAVLRQEGASIATVDQVGTSMAAVNTALALSTGKGAYGVEEGATSPVGPIQK